MTKLVVAETMTVVLECKIIEVTIAAKVCTHLWSRVDKIAMIVRADHITKIANLLVDKAANIGKRDICFVCRQRDKVRC